MNGRQNGFGIWITGLPASGKTTLAELLKSRLEREGLRVQVLDSEALRKVLTPNPTFDREERRWFYRNLVYIARMLSQQGVNVIFAATGHRRKYRDWGRTAIERFAEVYLNCYLSTCIRRDSKGIYRFGLSHTHGHVPGINEMYEVPLKPELVLNSDNNEPAELAKQLFGWIQTHFLQEELLAVETTH